MAGCYLELLAVQSGRFGDSLTDLFPFASQEKRPLTPEPLLSQRLARWRPQESEPQSRLQASIAGSRPVTPVVARLVPCPYLRSVTTLAPALAARRMQALGKMAFRIYPALR